MRGEGIPYEKFEEIQLKAKEYEEVEKLRHKWPRGLRQKLIDLDGGTARCFFCWSQQPGLHIAHIDFYGENGVFHYAYELDTMHSVKHLVLLCDSCHGKIDKAYSSNSPFKTSFMLAFKERLRALSDQCEEKINNEGEGNATVQVHSVSARPDSPELRKEDKQIRCLPVLQGKRKGTDQEMET